jgi:hypothetical protein
MGFSKDLRIPGSSAQIAPRGTSSTNRARAPGCAAAGGWATHRRSVVIVHLQAVPADSRLSTKMLPSRFLHAVASLVLCMSTATAAPRELTTNQTASAKPHILFIGTLRLLHKMCSAERCAHRRLAI